MALPRLEVAPVRNTSLMLLGISFRITAAVNPHHALQDAHLAHSPARLNRRGAPCRTCSCRPRPENRNAATASAHVTAAHHEAAPATAALIERPSTRSNAAMPPALASSMGRWPRRSARKRGTTMATVLTLDSDEEEGGASTMHSEHLRCIHHQHRHAARLLEHLEVDDERHHATDGRR
jgi:hypothetical protein